MSTAYEVLIDQERHPWWSVDTAIRAWLDDGNDLPDGDWTDAQISEVRALIPPPQPTPPATARAPRTYRTAAHWRGELERLERQRDGLLGYRRHDTDDLAAYGGIGIRQTGRQQRRAAQRMDTNVAALAAVDRRISQARTRLLLALAREGR